MENGIVCANCKTENSAKNLFCQNCGKPLTAARPAAPVEPIQPAQSVPQPPVTPPSFQPVIPPTPPVVPPYPPVTPPLQQNPPSTVQPPVFPVPPLGSVEPPKVEAPRPQVPRPVTFAPAASGTQVNQLGVTLDSWGDVIENGAEKGAAIADEFDRVMEERKSAQVQVVRKELQAEGAANGRTFHLVQSPQGETIAVYFGARGRDLIISWDAYVKPRLNLIPLLILLGGTAVVTLVISLIIGMNFVSFLFSWVNRFYNWLFPVFVAAALAGFFLKSDWLYFFIKRPNKFVRDDLMGLMLTVQQAIGQAVDAAGLDAGKLRAKKVFNSTNWFRRG